MAELTFTCEDICTDAAIECGALAPGEPLGGGAIDAAWVFRKFNNLIDTLQAGEWFAYGRTFALYTLVPNLQPHTIGPLDDTPTFSTGTQPRPVRLESAALLLNPNGTLVDLPMNIQDADWWASNQVKQITTSVPTDVYYNPANPLGELNFWPVPNQANQVRLQFWQTLSQFENITDPIGGAGGPGTLPQGYRNALMLTLAETLCPGLRITPNPGLVQAALQARAAVFGANAGSPTSATADYGMPFSGARAGCRQDFNFATGNRPGGRPQ